MTFQNNFANGMAGWGGGVGNLQFAAAAGMGAGGQGLLANMGGAMPGNAVTMMGPQPAYVYHATSEPLGYYQANFYFNPNGAFSGDTPIDIFAGKATSEDTIFGIQYQHTSAAPNVYQVRAWAEVDNGVAYSGWVTIANTAQNLQLDWRSRTEAHVDLYVNSSLAATFKGDTSETMLNEILLGPSAGVEGSSVAASGTMYFDEYTAFGAVNDMLLKIMFPLLGK